ncbi:MAG: YqgE/AlgH family protein, partial [Gammaproteobacteria bacterium]
IAMPGLADPNFFQTVTYLCEHDAQGAMGLVINRPTEMRLGELLQHIGIEVGDEAVRERPVFVGGPVQPERGFVLHEPIGDWEATLRVNDRIGVTASQDILGAIARGEGPRHYLVALGYAGWGAGQLEEEMLANAWLSGPADPEILFETPVEQRWQAAARRLGVDLHMLSGDAGHA